MKGKYSLLCVVSFDRSANTSMAFLLPNGIEIKLCSGPLKVKHRQSWLRSCDINDHSLTVKDVHASVYCMKDASCPSLKRLVQIPSISFHSKKGDLSVKFSECVDLYWSTLIHRILFDLGTLVKGGSKATKGDIGPGGGVSLFAVGNVTVALEKGLNLTAKLQTQIIQANLGSLSFNKYLAGYWKLNLPSFDVKLLPEEEASLGPRYDTYNSCSFDDSCMEEESCVHGGDDEAVSIVQLLAVTEVVVVKTVTSPLSKFRQEVEGLIDPENQTIVVSVNRLGINAYTIIFESLIVD